MPVTVRRVQAEEWTILKSVRLTALHEARYAFSTRYKDAVLRPDDQRQEMVANSAVSNISNTFLAFHESGPVPRLLAYVTDSNDRAIRFYEKAGF